MVPGARGRCSLQTNLCEEPLQSGRRLSLVAATWFHPVDNVNVNKRLTRETTGPVLPPETDRYLLSKTNGFTSVRSVFQGRRLQTGRRVCATGKCVMVSHSGSVASRFFCC